MNNPTVKIVTKDNDRYCNNCNTPNHRYYEIRFGPKGGNNHVVNLCLTCLRRLTSNATAEMIINNEPVN